MKETFFEAWNNGPHDYQDLEDALNEENFSRHLETYFMPDPDLLIRTGGEVRVSNYLLWQIAYSELYFCDTYWPAFSEEDLHKAIISYQNRQRRYGKTEAQIENDNISKDE
jgi:undecaprenyl diphosphate synthase